MLDFVKGDVSLHWESPSSAVDGVEPPALDDAQFRGFHLFRRRLDLEKKPGLRDLVDTEFGTNVPRHTRCSRQRKLFGGTPSSRTTSSSSLLERYGRWILRYDEDYGTEYDGEDSAANAENISDNVSERHYKSETARYLVSHGRDYCRGWIRAHPITTLQLLCGTLLYFGDSTFLLPARLYLFHPAAVAPPNYQLQRIFFNFLSLGSGFWEFATSFGAMMVWSSDTEVWLNGGGDVVVDGEVVQVGAQRLILDVDRKSPRYGTQKSLSEWLITRNRFLKYQLLCGLFLVSVETALYISKLGWLSKASSTPLLMSQVVTLASRQGTRSFGKLAQAVFSYSLFPELLESVRWLWALLAPSQSAYLFGVVPVNPSWLPFATLVLNGFTNWRSSVKGLAACLFASYMLDLRRSDATRELIITYFKRTYVSLGYILKSLFKPAGKGGTKSGGATSGRRTHKPKKSRETRDVSTSGFNVFDWTLISRNQTPSPPQGAHSSRTRVGVASSIRSFFS